MHEIADGSGHQSEFNFGTSAHSEFSYADQKFSLLLVLSSSPFVFSFLLLLTAVLGGLCSSSSSFLVNQPMPSQLVNTMVSLCFLVFLTTR